MNLSSSEKEFIQLITVIVEVTWLVSLEKGMLRHDLVLVVGMEPEFGLHKFCDPFQLKVFYDLMTVGWKYIKH